MLLRTISSRFLCDGFCFLEAPRVHERGILVSDVYGGRCLSHRRRRNRNKGRGCAGSPVRLGPAPEWRPSTNGGDATLVASDSTATAVSRRVAPIFCS